MTDLLDTLDNTKPPDILPGEVLDEDDDRDDDCFDWLADDSIVMQEQRGTAVYRNRANAIVIRQEGVGSLDDQFVILRDPEAVRLLITALRRELGGGDG
jgi:hypothetical protein